MPLTADELTICQHLLIDDEGMKEFPYFDCCGKAFRLCKCPNQGKLSIGVGRNLEDVGLSENECIGLELNDVKRVTASLDRVFPWFAKLNTPRRIVIVSMAFNMGVEGLKQFQKMIKSIESGDFESAGNQMLASQWAAQVKTRAVKLANLMKTGQF